MELTSAELSMLLEGITPLRVERRYRLGERPAADGVNGGAKESFCFFCCLI